MNLFGVIELGGCIGRKAEIRFIRENSGTFSSEWTIISDLKPPNERSAHAIASPFSVVDLGTARLKFKNEDFVESLECTRSAQ